MRPPRTRPSKVAAFYSFSRVLNRANLAPTFSLCHWESLNSAAKVPTEDLMPIIGPTPHPAGAHGLYDFGFPSTLIGVHFPHGEDTSQSKPWYWFITQQTPRYFQFISASAGGHGWQCEQFLPIIKILPIDTQKLVPTTQVGFASATEAATRIDNGEPISGDAFGRLKFTGKRFWDVIGEKKPEFTVERGKPTSHFGVDIKNSIKDAADQWTNFWNQEGNQFNAAFQGVDGGTGEYTVIQQSPFQLPLPPLNITLPQLQKDAAKYYFGAAPATILFRRGLAFFWKSAYCFRMGIGQLDATEWDMSVFPPRDASKPLSGRVSSSVSGNYGGYGVGAPDFPQVGLNIN